MWARWAGPRLRLAAVVHILSPTAGLYILMPERPTGHNNTIGLTGVFRRLRRFQRSAILRLTPTKHAHISAAPTANGAYRKRRAYLRRRSLRPKWYPSPASGLDLPDQSDGRALYASLVRKGIRRRRRTSVPCLGSGIDVFVVASSKSVARRTK